MTLSLHLAREIRAFAKSAGRQFTATEIQTIETTASSVASLDDAGQVRFDLGAGPVGTLDAALEMLSLGMGTPVTSKTSTPATSIPAGTNHTARALALNTATRDGQSAARLIEGQALVDENGSPWDPRTINRTRQALVRNLHPELADRLVRQAGARS